MNDDGLTKVEERLLRKVNDLESINEDLISDLERANQRVTELESVLEEKNIKLT